MTDYRKSPAPAWFSRLSTGPKMLLILLLALLPLGILAIFAAINSLMSSRVTDRVEAQAVLSVSAQRLSSAVTRAAVPVRLASDSVRDGASPAAGRACQQAAAQMLGENARGVRFVLYAPGNRMVCATQGFAPPAPMDPFGATSRITLDPEASALRMTLYDQSGQAQGQVELPAATLAAITGPTSSDFPGPVEFDLTDASGSIPLYDSFEDGPLVREVVLSEPVLGDQLELRLRAAAQRLSWGELLLILLPVGMWLFAALIGWFVIQRLLLRPLSRMEKAIAAYQPGDRGFERPNARSPAREIADLGDAFDQVTRTVASHEADLEAAVERQTRLVREVHHRVKNNLQVVASLLNLHSRGSASEEVAAAYASIQRRVDALAVVHRNHYAELEENRGVALKPLISELGASLRASVPAGSGGMQIRLALEPLYATQDVAVSIAFLVTEVVEYAMICGSGLVSITLEDEEEGRARMTLESESLAGEAACSPELHDRFDRIVTGLSRQLRSQLDRDVDNGRYGLTINVVGRGQG